MLLLFDNPHPSGRPFAAASQRLWNKLSVHLLDSGLTLLEFRRLMKTHLLISFGCCVIDVSALYKCYKLEPSCQRRSSLINKVNRRRARLVLGWMTVFRRVNHLGITSCQGRLTISFLWGR